MRHRVGHELREIGMREERTGRVKNPDDAMLPGPLRLHEIVEDIEPEIGGKDAAHFTPQG